MKICGEGQITVCFSSRVSLHMQREMVTAGKCSFTEVTLEGFAASVLPVVAGQLV